MSAIGLGFSTSTDDHVHIATNLSSQKIRPRWTMVSMNSATGGLGQSMKLFMRDAGINKFGNKLLRGRAAFEGDDDTSEPGDFVLHEVKGSHEYGGVTWIRSECHFEGLPNDEKTQDAKLMFIERALYSMDLRIREQQGRCRWFLMVKREDSYRKHVPWSLIYGTMELNIRYFSPGQKFPLEHIAPLPLSQVDTRVSNSYIYISNLCAKRSARQQGLETLMLQYAIKIAKKSGIRKLFTRVMYDNGASLKVHQKNGFKVVDETGFKFYNGLSFLLCYEASTSELK